MKDYQYILLDWDGNLARTLDVWLEATRTPLEKGGIKLSDVDIALRCFGRSTEGFRELGVEDPETAVVEMDELAAKLLPEVELYPDALFVMEELKKKGAKTALITTSWRKNVMHLIDKYNLHHLFDVVIAHEDTQRHKPDPEPLEEALSKLGGEKEKAVMIGDSDKDIVAANRAGIDSILFYPKAHTKFYILHELQGLKPTYTVEDFKQIIDLVAS